MSLAAELRRVAEVWLVSPVEGTAEVEAAREDLELYAFVAAVMSEDE